MTMTSSLERNDVSWLDMTRGHVTPRCPTEESGGRGEDHLTTNVVGPPPEFNDMSLVKTAILSAMFVVSFAGNALTIKQLSQGPRGARPFQKSSINLLIVHLAISDLIVAFFCNVTDAVWASTVQWYAGSWACKVVKYLQLFGLYLSTYITVVIGLDRCMAVLYPLGRSNSKARVRILIFASYVLSAIFSLPQLFIFRVVQGPFREVFYQCVTHGSYSAKWQEQVYSMLSFLVMFVLPLLAMVASYSLIFSTVARKSRLSHRTGVCKEDEMIVHENGRARFFLRAKVKSQRLTALIVAAFIICWTPYQVVFIVHTFIETQNIDTRYIVWIFFFGMANSVVNPMIYGAFQFCSRHKQQRYDLKEEPKTAGLKATDIDRTTSAKKYFTCTTQV